MAIGSEVVNYGLKWLVHDVMQDVSLKFPTPISVMTLISDMNSSEKWPRRDISCDNIESDYSFRVKFCSFEVYAFLLCTQSQAP